MLANVALFLSRMQLDLTFFTNNLSRSGTICFHACTLCFFFVMTVSHFFLIFLSLLYQYCLQGFSLESDESGSALLMSYCFNTCSVCVIMDACFFAQETECNEQWKKKVYYASTSFLNKKTMF